MIFYDKLVILECESRHSFSTIILVTQISSEPRLIASEGAKEVPISSHIQFRLSIGRLRQSINRQLEFSRHSHESRTKNSQYQRTLKTDGHQNCSMCLQVRSNKQ